MSDRRFRNDINNLIALPKQEIYLPLVQWDEMFPEG